jgi:hypothetical protein
MASGEATAHPAWQAGLLACDIRPRLPGATCLTVVSPVTFIEAGRAFYFARSRSLTAARPRRIFTAFPDACADKKSNLRCEVNRKK